jgi:regulatory protein
MAGTVTALEIQKRNKERVNVYLDGAFAFSLDLMQAASLHKGQQLDEAAIATLRDADAVSRAVDRAARFLAYRPRSTEEVRRNLADKDTPEPVIAAAMTRLETLGYLDDRAFAAFWIDNRNTFKPLSPRALRYELRQKGVADTIIDEALADIDAADAAYRAAQGQLRKLHGTDRATFRHKLSAFLGRRGFPFDISREAIERLLEEIDLQDPDYFHETD